MHIDKHMRAHIYICIYIAKVIPWLLWSIIINNVKIQENNQRYVNVTKSGNGNVTILTRVVNVIPFHSPPNHLSTVSNLSTFFSVSKLIRCALAAIVSMRCFVLPSCERYFIYLRIYIQIGSVEKSGLRRYGNYTILAIHVMPKL